MGDKRPKKQEEKEENGSREGSIKEEDRLKYSAGNGGLSESTGGTEDPKAARGRRKGQGKGLGG